MRWQGIAALAMGMALLCGAAFGVSAQQTGTPTATTAGLLRPTIGLAEAQELAIAGRAGAAIRALKLEGDDETLAYEMKLTTGDDLEVDATSGQVRETERGDDRATAGEVVGTPLLQPAIGLIEAQERALSGKTGSVVRAVKLAGTTGTLRYLVELTGGGEAQVDATSGQVSPAAGGDDRDDGNGGEDEEEEDDDEDEDEGDDD